MNSLRKQIEDDFNKIEKVTIKSPITYEELKTFINDITFNSTKEKKEIGGLTRDKNGKWINIEE